MQIDLLSPSSFEGGHPHAQYDWLRDNAPVYWHEEPEGSGFWAVTSYEEVAQVGRDPATYSSEPTIMIADPDPAMQSTADDEHQMMLMMDPPKHTRFRRLISREFTQGPAAALAPRIRELARNIVDAVIAQGECDFVSDVAGELPSYVIAELMGIPLADGRQLYQLTEVLHTAPETLPENAQVQAAAEMFSYAATVYQNKRTQPANDLASQIVHAQVDGQQLDLKDFQLFFMLLIDAGGDTTRNLVAGGLHRLIEEPQLMSQLRASPELIPAARNEMLRTVSPVIYMRRTARKDTTLRGQPIRAGDKVVRYFGAANHDPSRFAEPQRFSFERSPNSHIAFGTGAHVCLGQHLARVEIDCMLAEVLERMQDIALIQPPQWLPSNFISGIKHMPIRFSAG